MKNVNYKIIQVLLSVFILSLATMGRADDTTTSGTVVNINDATELELAYLPGIGPSTAAHIVAYREKQPFQKPQHLMRVKGIGRKTFQKLESHIVVRGQTTATKKIKASGSAKGEESNLK